MAKDSSSTNKVAFSSDNEISLEDFLRFFLENIKLRKR